VPRPQTPGAVASDPIYEPLSGSDTVLAERRGIRWQNGEASETEDPVAHETTFELRLDGRVLGRWVVSPADLREWGAGYVISEGLLSASGIHGVEVEGERVLVSSKGGSPERAPDALQAALIQRSSGYMGSPDTGLPVLTSGLSIGPARIDACSRALSEQAPGWRKTGGLHVAILVDGEGRFLKVAEDVGRHNALDKVIGAAHFLGVDPAGCAVVISGRMPQGMVTKVVRAGIPVAITKAASSDLGIDTAKRCHLTLICFARQGRFTVYSGEDRVDLSRKE